MFLFISKRRSPYKSKSFLAFSDKESKPSKIYFTLLIRSIRYGVGRNDGNVEGNVLYLQFLNYTNIKDLSSFENYVEIYAY